MKKEEIEKLVKDEVAKALAAAGIGGVRANAGPDDGSGGNSPPPPPPPGG